MKMRRIYIACPYSHEDKAIMKQRFEVATHLASKLMEQGHLVYSPLTHGHPMCEFNPNLRTCFEGNKEHCLSFIEHWATELLVVTIDGYLESIGVQEEIKFSIKHGKQVDYTDHQLNAL